MHADRWPGAKDTRRDRRDPVRVDGLGVRLSQWFYFLCVIVTVVPLGAVHDPVIAVAGLLFAALSVVCVFQPLRPQLNALVLTVMAFFGILTVWALAQTVPLGLAHPAWAAAAEALGQPAPRGTISVAPFATFAGLSSFLVPMMALLCAIVLFQDHASAQRLVWFGAVLALGGAIIGIYEFAFVPNQLLFQPRQYPMDGVTAFFVNRNTAATFLGIGAIVWTAILMRDIDKLGISGLRDLLTDAGGLDRRFALLLTMKHICFLTVIVALFLTKSRAGISASLSGIIIVLLVSLHQIYGVTKYVSRLAIVTTSVTVIGVLVTIYGRQYVSRLTHTDTEGGGRWCFFSGMTSAIGDWPLRGTGYATIRQVYPMYRDPSCIGLDVVLDRGHNGYLELAMGMGVIAALVIAAGIAALNFLLMRTLFLRKRSSYLSAAGLGAITTCVMHSGVDFSLQIPGISAYASAMLAAVLVSALPPMRRY